jgi:hypothetical protein
MPFIFAPEVPTGKISVLPFPKSTRTFVLTFALKINVNLLFTALAVFKVIKGD